MLERVFGDDVARRAAAASIATNSVLMVLKLSVGVISGSVAVLSDGIDSLEDVIASGITYASLRYGARPPDATHPYGHGRAETLAATFQGLLIGAGGVFILFRAVDRVLNPPESIDTGIAIAVMLVAAAANFALVQYVEPRRQTDGIAGDRAPRRVTSGRTWSRLPPSRWDWSPWR